MSEVDAILSIIDKVSQLSGPGLAVAILYLFKNKTVVWGWQLEEEVKRRETYEGLLNNHAAKTEAKLADYERREHGQAA